VKLSSLNKLLFVLLFILSLFFSCNEAIKWKTSTLLFFDTVCEIRLKGESSLLNRAKEKVFEVFTGIEKHFSPEVQDFSSPMAVELFQRGLDVYNDTDGCFDITVFPLSEAWGFFSRSYRIPPSREIESILDLVGMEKVKISNGVLVLQPGMRLDWGGIAKGYGIDLAAQALINEGVGQGFINAGGDLYCWGMNPAGEDWKIGIENPRKEGILGVLSLSDLAAATTGDYQRYFIEQGIRHHHVFDPRTGYPAQGKQSVTVIGPETVICDALSTALFVSMQPEEILNKYPEYGAVIVDAEGKVTQLGRSYTFQILE
jgi:thiamine biosynthesis lipoprotein